MAKEKEQKKQIAPLYTRAIFDLQTLDKEARTVDVIFATENPVRMRSYDIGVFDEVLSMKTGEQRFDRLNARAPLLNDHARYNGVLGVLGVCERAWISGKEARATIRFSKRADVEPVFQDVIDGILSGVSCGYRVYAYDVTEKENQVPIYRAVDWEAFEISLAPIPADIKSKVRAEENAENNNEVVIHTRSASNEETNTNTNTRKMEETPENKPGAHGGAPAGGNAPAPVKVEEVTRAAVESERKRCLDIKTAVRKAKLNDEFAENLITDGTTVEKARELIIEEFAKADPANGAGSANGAVTRAGADEVDKRRDGMSLAIQHRAMPTKESSEKVKGSEYRGMSLLRMAEDCVNANGGKTRGMDNAEIAKSALNLSHRGGMHSTSDFPIILGNTINRVLLAEYDLAPRTFPAWTRRGVATDFKTMTRARLGEFDSMDEVVEGAEYKQGSIGEGAETYKVKKYGKVITVSWETLVNDDLNAFAQLPQKIANTAARKQSDLIYAILSANAALSDGVALFHATHGNLGTAGDIDITKLGEARKLMRKQKGLNNKDFLNLTPSYLVVGPNMETLALQYTSMAYVPNTPSQTNPFKGLQVIVEPRITGNEWYVMTSTGQVDTIEYSFLEGEQELYTETRYGFEVDGVQTKCRMVFGAKAIDYRGMVKNAGS